MKANENIFSALTDKQLLDWIDKHSRNLGYSLLLVLAPKEVIKRIIFTKNQINQLKFR